jgi:L-histidine Nalpha-methyltransferase
MLSPFAKHVQEGLSARPRTLSSMYIYDTQGSSLFQEIMQMPDYYLTDAEYKILEQQSADIALLLQTQAQQSLDLVEFGAGDGTKTQLLLSYLHEQAWSFRYVPIDISESALEGLSQTLHQRWPDISVEPIVGDYFESLQQLSKAQNTARHHKLVLFLGSNVGNFSHTDAVDFFRHMHEVLNVGDQVLVGFDLKKDPQQILAAYHDPEGVTARFNQNVLARINRELGGNFDLSQFRYAPSYNPESGEVSAYQISLCDQEVYIESLDQTFAFKRWDTIHTEVSRKYSLETIEHFAATSGFETVAHFMDPNAYFVDSLWTKR